MTGDRADRELLFEALAVHLGFLGQDTHRDLNRARRDDAALGVRRSARSWSRAPC